MTNRLNSLTIVLEQDIREDDAEQLIAAVRMFRGVLSVTPNVSELSDHVAEQRVRRELGEKLWAVIYQKDAKP